MHLVSSKISEKGPSGISSGKDDMLVSASASLLGFNMKMSCTAHFQRGMPCLPPGALLNPQGIPSDILLIVSYGMSSEGWKIKSWGRLL